MNMWENGGENLGNHRNKMSVRNHEKTTKNGEKTQENLTTKGKSRENTMPRKSRNTLTKPMKMWKK